MSPRATNPIGTNMAKFEAEVEILTPEEAGIEVTPAMAERARLARQAVLDRKADEAAERERRAE